MLFQGCLCGGIFYRSHTFLCRSILSSIIVPNDNWAMIHTYVLCFNTDSYQSETTVVTPTFTAVIPDKTQGKNVYTYTQQLYTAQMQYQACEQLLATQYTLPGLSMKLHALFRCCANLSKSNFFLGLGHIANIYYCQYYIRMLILW